MHIFTLFSCFAVFAGGAIAIQAAMNAQLGVLLKSAIMSTSIAFLLSFVFMAFVLIVSTKQYPNVEVVQSVPVYLWFGGVLSALGVGLFYYLIPKMGAGSMMSYALTGQILVAMVISHFGWFDLPIKPINHYKIIGAVLLVIGLIFVNWEPKYVY